MEERNVCEGMEGGVRACKERKRKTWDALGAGLVPAAALHPLTGHDSIRGFLTARVGSLFRNPESRARLWSGASWHLESR